MMPSFSTTLLGRELEGGWVETVKNNELKWAVRKGSSQRSGYDRDLAEGRMGTLWSRERGGGIAHGSIYLSRTLPTHATEQTWPSITPYEASQDGKRNEFSGTHLRMEKLRGCSSD